MKREARKNPPPPRALETRTCSVCAKPFQSRRYKGFTCSAPCALERGKVQLREARQSRAPVPEARTCPVCNTTFRPRQFNPAAGRQVTCSARCGYERTKARARDSYVAMSPDEKERFLSDLAAKRGQDPAKHREIRARSRGRRRLLEVTVAVATKGQAGGA